MILEDYDDKYVHIVPTKSIQEHTTTINCWCKPIIDQDEPTVFIHNYSLPMDKDN
jgi:hypothetical protein